MVSIGEDDKGIPVPAKIVFVRDRRTKKWLALLSTDTSLDSEEIVTAYKRRWDIEVFFKMAKSFLNLAKECQGRSYDALVAHATVVCCRYIMLAVAKRTNKDPRIDRFLRDLPPIYGARWLLAWQNNAAYC